MLPRVLLSELRAFVSLSGSRRARVLPSAPDTLENSVLRLVHAIDRSLCLARAAGNETSRDAHAGIARLNFTALRGLTSDFSRGVTPEVRRLAHAFTQPDPWSFAVLRADDTTH